MPLTPHFFLLFLWGFTTVHFHDLPKEIPIHFNAKGVPDSYATRIHTWGIPLIATFLFFTLNFFLGRIGVETHEKMVLFLDASHFDGYFLLYPIPKFSRCAEKKCWPWNLVFAFDNLFDADSHIFWYSTRKKIKLF